ncbi:MAG: hypothetical protein ACSHX9_00130 [Luteolibacter sp.]
MKTKSLPSAEDAFRKSGFFEQLVEHAFISEILQEVYFGCGHTVEVLRSELDAYGYDLILECNGIMRHVQLKTSRAGGRTAVQKVHTSLASKPSGCVVWVIRHEDPETRRMRLSYRFFGGAPGNALPPMNRFKVAKHTKGNASGEKKERPAIRIVPKGKFQVVETTGELVNTLFGITLAL